MRNIVLIAALGENSEIGGKGKLLWKIPEDLKNFKEVTTGKTVIMGRKTWESLPVKPLPNRRNIIITRDPNYKATGAIVYNNLEDALKEDGKICIIGGGEIYKQALPYANLLRLTRIYKTFPEADTFFPEFSEDEWELIVEEPKSYYCFELWERRK